MGSYHNARVFASLCVYFMMYMLWTIATKSLEQKEVRSHDISEEAEHSAELIKVTDASHDVEDGYGKYIFLALIAWAWILLITGRVITGKW